MAEQVEAATSVQRVIAAASNHAIGSTPAVEDIVTSCSGEVVAVVGGIVR